MYVYFSDFNEKIFSGFKGFKYWERVTKGIKVSDTT